MSGQLKPVYFPAPGTKFGYAKAIVDIDYFDFFFKMGAVKTQEECHMINNGEQADPSEPTVLGKSVAAAESAAAEKLVAESAKPAKTAAPKVKAKTK